MVDEVLAGESVHPVLVAGQVRGGDGDQLAVPGAPASSAARASRSGPAELISAAATSRIGSLLVSARCRMATGA